MVDSSSRVKFMVANANSSLTPIFAPLSTQFTTNLSVTVVLTQPYGFNPFITATSNLTTLTCMAQRTPRNLAAAPVTGGTSMSMTWLAPSTPPYIVTGYRIMYRRAPTAQWNRNQSIVNAEVYDYVKTVNVSSVLATTISGLQPFIVYNFKILAFTVQDGDSFISSEISASTSQAAPSMPPQNVAVTSIGATWTGLSWTLPVVEGRNGILTSYVVTFTRVNGQTNANPSIVNPVISTNVGNMTTFNQTGLQAYIQYSIMIAAVTQPDGATDAVGVAGAAFTSLTNQFYPADSPVLGLTPISPSSITAAWSAIPSYLQNGPVGGYLLHYQMISPQVWVDGTVITNTDAGFTQSFPPITLTNLASSFNIPSLLAGISYDVQILTYNSFNTAELDGLYSQFINATTFQSGTILIKGNA